MKCLYGKETAKALINFGKGQLPVEIIRAYAEVKKAVVMAIQEMETGFDEKVYSSIMKALDEIASGVHNEQFPLPLAQGGAGTSVNMNVNEVTAARASELCESLIIDPITDINRYQSTNDTFPTAVTIVLLRKLHTLEGQVVQLQEVLVSKESEYSNVLLTGRTEMQDALPITLGQVFASWAGASERDRWRLNKLKERLRTIPLGGTAVGTGYPAPQNVVFTAEKYLRNITGLNLSRSQNLTDEIASQDKLSELADGLKLCAETIFKMTGDLLLYSSSFIGEIHHPDLQAGSTIMAAKTNPVIVEFARGLSIDCIHECAKISEYCRNGQLQLNAYLPFILEAFLRSFNQVDKAINALIYKFFALMELDLPRIESNLLSSNALLNTLLPVAGYHKVKEAFQALKEAKPATMEEYKAVVAQSTGLNREVVDYYFDARHSTTFFKGKK